MELASGKLGVTLRSFDLARERSALDSVFAAILRDRPDGLLVVADALAGTHTARIVDFATRNRIPTMSAVDTFAAEGGLISYGGDYSDGWRIAARYVDRILRGARPTDLPVEQPTKFYVAINLRTAKALGVTISPSLLLRADRIVE